MSPQAGPELLPPAPTSKTSALAVASVVAGILSFWLLPFVGSALRIMLGIQARNQINASNGRLQGLKQARLGRVLGWVSLGLWSFLVLSLLIIAESFCGDDPTCFA